MRGGPGRPRFDVSKEQLEYLSLLSFKWNEIAVLLGVSRMTVYRYVKNLIIIIIFRQWLEVRQPDLVGRARGPTENFLRKKDQGKSVIYRSSARIEPGTSSSTVEKVTSK